MYSARIDQTISTLVDLTGANERIFKSPIPLVYTRLTARFLTIFLTLLPLALWAPLADTWNHSVCARVLCLTTLSRMHVHLLLEILVLVLARRPSPRSSSSRSSSSASRRSASRPRCTARA